MLAEVGRSAARAVIHVRSIAGGCNNPAAKERAVVGAVGRRGSRSSARREVERVSQLRGCAVRLGFRWIAAGTDVGCPGPARHRSRLFPARHIGARTARLALCESEQVVKDDHLAVTAGAGSDADRRNVHVCGHSLRESIRHPLEHDGEASCLSQRGSASRRSSVASTASRPWTL